MIGDRGLVSGVHGIRATNHEDEVKGKAEILQTIGEFVEVIPVGARDDRDLDGIYLNPAEIAELFDLGEDYGLPVVGARN